MVSRKCLFSLDRYFIIVSQSSLIKMSLCAAVVTTYLALLNLSWAKNPQSLSEPLQRTMAALLVLIAWASSAWYIKRGIKSSGILTAVAGILQAWAALH